jgi:hypothetical protein
VFLSGDLCCVDLSLEPEMCFVGEGCFFFGLRLRLIAGWVGVVVWVGFEKT